MGHNKPVHLEHEEQSANPPIPLYTTANGEQMTPVGMRLPTRLMPLLSIYLY